MRRTIYSRGTPVEGGPCRLVVVGDLCLSGEVARRHPPAGRQSRLFDDVAPILKTGDIVFGNLETPLCTPAVDRDLFRGHPAHAGTIADAGFDVLSLANNHILEYGPEGLHQCAGALADSGIMILGAGENQEAARRPVILDRCGLRIGMLGFGRTLQKQSDPSIPGFVEWNETLALEMVRDLRPSVDLIVVSIHIGYMWVDYPSPQVKRAADRLLEAGAHVVLMHHAHVLQGYQAGGGRLAIYNLGNFIADIDEGEIGGAPVPERQRESAIFLIELDRRGVVEVVMVPITFDREYRVTVAPDELASRIIERNGRIARDIESGAYRSLFLKQRAELNTGNILAWCMVHLRQGHWLELGASLLRARPQHLVMLARYAARGMATLWKRL